MFLFLAAIFALSACARADVVAVNAASRAELPTLGGLAGNFTLQLRTCASEAEILYQDGLGIEFMLVEVSRGVVAVRWDFGSGPQEAVQDGIRVDDCLWHSIGLSFKASDGLLTLTLDGINSVTVSYLQYSSLNANLPLLLGSVARTIDGTIIPPKGGAHGTPLVGCVANVRRDGVLSNLLTLATVSNVTANCALVDPTPAPAGADPTADTAAATLHTDSQLTFGTVAQGVPTSSTADSLSVYVRTRQRAPRSGEALVFFTAHETDGDFQLLSINAAGNPVFRYSNGGNAATTATASVAVDLGDGAWHRITVARTGATATLLVDDGALGQAAARSSSSQTVFNAGATMDVGTWRRPAFLPPALALPSLNFVSLDGCLASVVFNGKTLTLPAASIATRVTAGCTSAPNVCNATAGGLACAAPLTCFDTWSAAECACPLGRLAPPSCLDINECLSDPCFNGAACANLDNAFGCTCRPGWLGQRCEAIDECAVFAPCHPTATCTDTASAPFQCHCPPGRYGPLCAQLCTDGGVVVGACLGLVTCNAVTGAQPTCLAGCAPGWFGPLCTAPCNTTGTRCAADATITCAQATGLAKTCATCAAGFYGSRVQNASLPNDCTLPCPPTPATCSVPPTGCAKLTGALACPACAPGAYGADCTLACDASANNCAGGVLTCAQQGGLDRACPLGCLPGWFGRDCRSRCPAVPHCVATATCAQSDGAPLTCTACLPSYTGALCDGACNATWCASPANVTCRQSDGGGRVCGGCATGHFGQDCANLCDPGHCLDPFLIDGTTDRVTCRQSDGANRRCVRGCTDNQWWGVDCVVPCRVGHCTSAVACRQSDGAARVCSSCELGYGGPDCELDLNDCVTATGQAVCLHGGVCTDRVAAFSCQCPAPYTGPTCANDVDECAQQQPCRNGATCAQLPLSAYVPGQPWVGYTCTCPAGFTGPTCEVNIDDCTPNKCLFGATCVDGLNAFSCLCAPGFLGTLCATNIDDCASPTPLCVNGGTCVDGANDFRCACAAGFSGLTCATNINECASNPCLNGGSCTDAVNGFTCACAAGYTGVLCATDINECADAPCNAVGTERCVDQVARFSCVCRPGYDGPLCAALTTATFSGTGTGAGAGVGVGASLAFSSGLVADRAQFSLALDFATSVSDGVLLYTSEVAGGTSTNPGAGDLWAVELVNGAVVVTLQLGSPVEPPLVARLPGVAADGAWHHLAVNVSAATLVVSLDQGRPVVLSGDGAYSALNVGGPATPLYLGAPVPWTTRAAAQLTATRAFAGCLRQVVVNGAVLDLLTSAASGGVTPGCQAGKGATGRQCDAQPGVCGPQGVCVDLWDTLRCDCAPAVTGRWCEAPVVPVTFSAAAGVLEYAPPQAGAWTEDNFTLTVNLRTTRSTGTVWMLADRDGATPDALELLLTDGFVSLQLSLGGNPAIDAGRSADAWAVNDGRWHLLRFARVVGSRTFAVTVDNASTSAATLAVPLTLNGAVPGRLNQVTPRLFLGGRRVGGVGLQGCVQDVRFNNRPLDLGAGEQSWVASNDAALVAGAPLVAVRGGAPALGCTCAAELCAPNTTFCRAQVRSATGEAFSCPAVAVCPANASFAVSGPGLTSDRVCAPQTQCGAVGVQFELSAPQPSADRVCRDVARCAVLASYQTRAPTATSDRQCQPCSVCTADQFEAIPCSLTSDTVCAPCTRCHAGVNFSATPCSRTADTVCEACGHCAAESFETRACTPFANTVCAQCQTCALTTSEPGAVGSRQYIAAPCTELADRACAACTPCAPAFYVAVPCGPEADTWCDPCTVCPATHFQVSACAPAADTVCQALTVCRVGLEYESRAATATTDRVCTPLTTCVPNVEWERVAPTPTSNRQCAVFSPRCAARFFERQHPSPTTDRLCAPCTRCFLGEYQASLCNETTDTVCSPCLCAHGGLCLASVETTSYTCECTRGWAPPTCAAELDECLSAPCLNGGTCTDKFAGFACSCPPTHTGLTCQINIDDCREFSLALYASTGRFENPCLHGGACVDGLGSFTCTCPAGFGGARCEAVIEPSACVACAEGQSWPADSGACPAASASPCLPCATCPPSVTYTAQPCTLQNGGSDTVCEPITACVANQTFETAGPTAGSDRVCQACSTCPALYHVLAACTLTSDTVCAPDDPCVLNPCADTTALGCAPHPVTGFQCVCPPGWTGKTCSVREAACSVNPCLHGGVCDGFSDESFACACVGGYVGPTCGVNVAQAVADANQALADAAARAAAEVLAAAARAKAVADAAAAKAAKDAADAAAAAAAAAANSQGSSSGPNYNRLAIYVGVATGGVALLLFVAIVAVVCAVGRNSAATQAAVLAQATLQLQQASAEAMSVRSMHGVAGAGGHYSSSYDDDGAGSIAATSRSAAGVRL